MARPIALDMRNCTLAATVQAGVVARANARVGRIQVMECCRKRREVVLRRLAVLALCGTCRQALRRLGSYSLATIGVVRVGVWVWDQGHCRLGGVEPTIASSLPNSGPAGTPSFFQGPLFSLAVPADMT
jgi:hypothetical protein